jgi:hypothetical protein
MTKSYHKICDYCEEEIEMSNKGGKWLPYNLNNGPHDCRERDRENKRQPEEQNHKEITLETIKKKLESIGIVIDLDKLMNQK